LNRVLNGFSLLFGESLLFFLKYSKNFVHDSIFFFRNHIYDFQNILKIVFVYFVKFEIKNTKIITYAEKLATLEIIPHNYDINYDIDKKQ